MVQDLKHVNCKLSCFRLCFTIFVFCAQHFGPLYQLAFSWAKSPAAKSGSTKLWRLYLWLARASEGSWYCFRSFMFPMHRRQTFQGLLQGCLCGSVWPILTLEFATDTSDRDSIISYLRSQVFNLQNMSLFYYSIVQKGDDAALKTMRTPESLLLVEWSNVDRVYKKEIWLLHHCIACQLPPRRCDITSQWHWFDL